MASKNITLTLGLIPVVCKTDVATITKTSLAYLCTGQPGHDEHPPSPRKAPYTCDVCGPITDNDVLKRGVKSGQTYTLVDAAAAVEAKESYASTYKDGLRIVGHPASEFLANTGQGDSIHYLTPADARQSEGYAVLAALIERHPEIAFAGLYTPSTATALFQLTVRDGVIVMLKRTRESSLKPLPAAPTEVNEGHYAVIESFLDGLCEPYDGNAYEDTYQSTLAELVAGGEQVVDGNNPTASTDFLAALNELQAAANKPAKKSKKKETAA